MVQQNVDRREYREKLELEVLKWVVEQLHDRFRRRCRRRHP